LAPPGGVGQSERFNNQQGDTAAKQLYELLKDLMFHPKTDGGQMNNSGLRPFDQSWRLQPEKTAVPGQPDPVWPHEVILVARTPTLYDHSETVACDPGSATRLWLGRLPGGKAERPALSGFLGQQTYIRAYIPIQSPK
jgi:hypothetical protein